MNPLPTQLTLKLVLIIGCALLVALLVHDRNRWKAKTSHYAELLAGERGAHAATIANVRAAAEQARRADADNAARVRSEQAAINERSADDYQSRIAAARAAAGRMRPDTPGHGATSGGGGTTQVPGLSPAAERIARGADKDRLPDAGESAGGKREALAGSDALTATEQAIQLDELIRWVRAQAEVEVSRD